MVNVRKERMTANIEGDCGDLLIGMRINAFWRPLL